MRMDLVRPSRPLDSAYHKLTREVGVAALPGIAKRSCKRKAPESDKVTINDETATSDANRVLGAEGAGEKARSNHSFLQ